MISYCHKQKHVVESICNSFRRKIDISNCHLWIDTEQMQAGVDIKSQMHQAVQESDVVVLMLSREYSKSPNCTFERELAAVLGKRVIPVYLDNSCETEQDGLLYIRHTTDVEATALSLKQSIITTSSESSDPIPIDTGQAQNNLNLNNSSSSPSSSPSEHEASEFLKDLDKNDLKNLRRLYRRDSRSLSGFLSNLSIGAQLEVLRRATENETPRPRG